VEPAGSIPSFPSPDIGPSPVKQSATVLPLPPGRTVGMLKSIKYHNTVLLSILRSGVHPPREPMACLTGHTPHPGSPHPQTDLSSRHLHSISITSHIPECQIHFHLKYIISSAGETSGSVVTTENPGRQVWVQSNTSMSFSIPSPMGSMPNSLVSLVSQPYPDRRNSTSSRKGGASPLSQDQILLTKSAPQSSWTSSPREIFHTFFVFFFSN